MNNQRLKNIVSLVLIVLSILSLLSVFEHLETQYKEYQKLGYLNSDEYQKMVSQKCRLTSGKLIFKDPIDGSTRIITDCELARNPGKQLWYLGNSSSSNKNIILLNRIDLQEELKSPPEIEAIKEILK